MFILPTLLLKILKGYKHILNKTFSKFNFEVIVVVLVSILLSGIVVEILKTFPLLVPSHCLSDFLVLMLFFYCLSFIAWKVYNRYLLGRSQYLFLIAILTLFLVIRYGDNNLDFQSFSWELIGELKYIDLLITLPLVTTIGGLLLMKIDKKVEVKNESIYVSDAPFIPEFKNISVQAYKVRELVLKGNYDDSFSVGVIAAWGYGKSSFLEEVKLLFRGNDEVIEVHFSPYLNHNEDDVVSEFFNAFKSGIQPYSGALSKSISHYAASITKAYRRGEAKELLNSSFNPNSDSAFELYKKVEELILLLGRKIIIYIDDLDRLSAKEILQVFKLIRNTSKFPRTFFIVSLDKNMVLNELTTTIPNSRKYIDKFFQLEINLPKIDGSVLRNEFLTLLDRLNKLIPNYKEAKEKIEKTLKTSSEAKREADKKCLFDLYINNFRDVKKLYNQIANDVSNIPHALNEFDTNDYLNFVLLRLKFPEIYSIILLDPNQILSTGTFNPKGLGPQIETNEETVNSIGPKAGKYFYFQGKQLQQLKNYLKDSNSTNVKNIDEKNIDEAKVDSIIEEKKELMYSKSELELAKRTLELVFSNGKPGKISLNREERMDAFYKMQFSPEHLSSLDFYKLINQDIQSEEGEKFFVQLVNENKWNQIVENINVHIIKTKEETKNIVKLICYVLVNEYSLNVIAGNKFEMLSNLLDSNQRKSFHKDKKSMLSDQDKVRLLNQYVFDNKGLNIESRIYLVNWIKKLEDATGLWGYSNEALKTIGEKLFLEFLEIYIDLNKGWTSEGSILKKNFNYLVDSVGKESLLNVLRGYLTKDNVEYFLTELIQLNHKSDDDHSIAFSYRLNDELIGLFENEKTFNEFFKLLQNKLNSDAVAEFLKFCQLQIKLGKPFIKYHFKNIYTPDRSFFTENQYKRAEESTQFIFEFNNDIRHFTPKFNDERLKNKYIGDTEKHSASKCVLFDVSKEGFSDEELSELVFNVMHKELSDSTTRHEYTMPELPIQIGASIKEGTTPMITLIHKA